MAKKIKKDYIYALGRRKSASARVRLHKGTGDNTVNDKLIGVYFPGEAFKVAWNRPFEITKTTGKYHITIKVVGGGKNGQLDASILGISRALAAVSVEFRKLLKKEGLLTRDARERERRKVGTGGKARRKKQSPKR